MLHILFQFLMSGARLALIFPETPRGNNYLITTIVYFSKWAEAEPIPTKEAIHVANFLKKMIMRHGCPQEIISDQVI